MTTTHGLARSAAERSSNDNGLGTISVADQVVQKIAARAALESPDAGSAATRVLGVSVPGAGHLGVRGNDLHGLPKTSIEVDGDSVYVDLTISVRWPADIAAVTDDVRRNVAAQIAAQAGMTVQEVDITVADLVTDLPAARRTR